MSMATLNKPAWADLHSHSTASDGRLSPSQLLGLAAEKGLALLALTDHDSVAGLAEAGQAANSLGVKLLAGVEISIDFEPGTFHMVGLGFDPGHLGLLAGLDKLRQAREARNPKVLEKLQGLGLDLSWADVQGNAKGGLVGRPHFAQALIQKGFVKTFDEAFDRYLAKGRPAYVPKARLGAQAALDLIHGAEGLAVLAHPIQLGLQGPELRQLIGELHEQGLDAIEVWHPDHGPDDVKVYRDLAHDLSLGSSGGSDYHAIPGKAGELGLPGMSLQAAQELLKGRIS